MNVHFPKNLREVSDTAPLYPTTFKRAKTWFRQFLNQRFYAFGTYKDAIVSHQSILHHSLLSPLINCGLLDPSYIVDEILAFAAKNNIAINNTEVIIRQTIG